MSDHLGNFRKSRRLQQKARTLVPGGSHTYAKGEDQYPVLAPGFIERGLGCHVWDVDGNEYIEYGLGNRAVGLGHAYPTVLRAVGETLRGGCNFTKPARIEIDCAETFLDIVPGAEMVKFCRTDPTRRPALYALPGPIPDVTSLPAARTTPSFRLMTGSSEPP
jgi:glutamate-1-semialdehyde 2,1-aminomutase